MGITYNTNIIRDSLVLYLDAANVKSYSGSGTDWYDLSGNGNNGINYGLDYLSDIANGCFEYYASADRTYISENLIENCTSMSMSAWFMMSGAANNTWRCVVHKGTDSSVGGSKYWTGFSNTNKIVSTIGSEDLSRNYLAGDTGVVGEYGKWYNTISTWDGNIVKVYLDGNYIKQYDLANLANTTAPTRLGGCNDRGGYQIYGKIGTVAIYKNKALSEEEVKHNYNALKGRYL